MYCVFTLSDPQDPDLPKLVAWGDGRKPWVDLWQRENGLEANIARWFADLKGRDLKPLLLAKFECRTMKDAEHLAKFLTERIMRMSGTWPDVPRWYLGRKPGRPKVPRRAAKAVVRELPDGQMDRWTSIRQAALSSGRLWQSISRWCRSGIVDPDGCSWWFDCSDCSDCYDCSE